MPWGRRRERERERETEREREGEREIERERERDRQREKYSSSRCITRRDFGDQGKGGKTGTGWGGGLDTAPSCVCGYIHIREVLEHADESLLSGPRVNPSMLLASMVSGV